MIPARPLWPSLPVNIDFESICPLSRTVGLSHSDFSFCPDRIPWVRRCNNFGLHGWDTRIMILYHFTPADLVEQILEDGLLPYHDLRNMLGGAEVVWLTERTDTRCTAADTAGIFEWSGEVMEHWLSFAQRKVVRLAVRMPSHDRRLFRYRPWLRKHWRPGMPHPDNKYMDFTGANAHWIYFGEIPLSKIVEVGGPGASVMTNLPSNHAAFAQGHHHLDRVRPQARALQ
jgi:hypothetical protein